MAGDRWRGHARDGVEPGRWVADGCQADLHRGARGVGAPGRRVASAAVPGGAVLLVSSSGGVLLDLLALRPWWERHERHWLVVDAPDTREVLADERVTTAPELAPADVPALVRATLAARRLLRTEAVGCVVSAGSGIAVPVFLAARLAGVPAFWLETRNVLTGPGLAARLGGGLASAVLVQHRELLGRNRRAVLLDALY